MTGWTHYSCWLTVMVAFVFGEFSDTQWWLVRIADSAPSVKTLHYLYYFQNYFYFLLNYS